jgi:amino acid permease
MQGRSEANLNQLASDVHFITAPFRFLWHMFLWAGFLLVIPIIFIAIVVFGLPYISGDELSLLKVLEVVLGPFAFTLSWIIFTHFSHHHRARRLIERRSCSEWDYTERELRFLESLDKPRHLRTFAVLFTSFAGSAYAAYLLHDAADQQFLILVLMGISVPAILMAAFRLISRCT